MIDSENQEFIPMHFIWVERGIQDAIKLRNSLQGANKNDKEKIAHNIALDNIFMLKRNNNVCFSNLIYQKIVEDREKLDKIIREISKILVDSFMDEKSLKDAIYNNFLRAEIFDSSLGFTDFILKANKTHSDALKYLQYRWENFMHQGDREEAIAAEAYFREYLTGRIHYEILFSKSQLYEGVTHPQRYTYHGRSYSINSVQNYRLYQTVTDNYPNFLGELKTLFAEPIKKKLISVMKSLFDIEEDSEFKDEYMVFINRLLSIASTIYFKSLSTNDKIDLLNQKLSLEKLVSVILEKGVGDFKSWVKIIDCLNEYSFFNLAQRLIEPFKPQISILNISDKMVTYEVLAKIYRNQENYAESLKYLNLTLDCFNSDTDDVLKKTILFEILLISEIAELNGKLSDSITLAKYLTRLRELKNKLIDIKKKYEACYRISKVYKYLERFEEERAYLIELIDLNYREASSEQIIYIDLRIDAFYTTKMKVQKLSYIEKQAYLRKRLFEANECVNHLYLFEGEEKFQELLKFLNHNPEIGSLKEIYKHLGFVNLYNREYQKSVDYFSHVLELSDDLESTLYSSISYYMMGKKSTGKELLHILPSTLKNADDRVYVIFDYWLLTAVNFLSINEVEIFFQLISDPLQPNMFGLWINIGKKLADFGFIRSAQQFINLSLSISESNQEKALCYNILGTIMANKDSHNEAINQYLEALKLDRKYILCYQNLGRSYMHKHDFPNAIRSFKNALDLVSTTGYPKIEIESIKSDLSYCESYKGNSFNINRITSEKVRNALISAERIYLHFHDKKDLLDASSIINSYSKALEIMVHEEISPLFNPLIKIYREKYFKQELGTNFHIKFGNLFRKKTISLGVWSQILKEFQQEQEDSILKEFKMCLTQNASEDLLNSIKSACDYIRPIRNPLSHQENASLAEVMERRIEIIVLFNRLIDKLYSA